MTDSPVLKKIAANAALLLFALLFASSCGPPNGFVKYYRENPGAGRLLPYSGEPRLLMGKNPDSDAVTMIEDGYTVKGTSVFNGPHADPDLAKEQAKMIGAEVVILYSKFNRTVSGVAASSFGSAYGTGGPNSFAGFSGATAYAVPFSVDRYDHLAAYWIKAPRGGMGAVLRELNADERESLRRSRGVFIVAVRKGSRAESAGVYRGDIIVEIGGREIDGVRDFLQLVKENAGREVTVGVLRDGRGGAPLEKKEIRVKLNEAIP
jgi:membrane-associated protease RseP (regulator of RpoE activity)